MSVLSPRHFLVLWRGRGLGVAEGGEKRRLHALPHDFVADALDATGETGDAVPQLFHDPRGQRG
ncbi:hypothetical protein ACQEVM_36025 [Streptomyces sp. CA-243310]|uniref:hypothetical protein n=1 Tax=Streptomyces sp. CA-243310 TaxID=3240056 RepID=UPI003D8E536B